ncbi:MAG: hypothetical protein KDJ31_08620 [Candidatus Competibacteraceae bacterium]|nr:hypothetical protein [Candidatus Competibacteraceae bacterium]HRY15517.1 glutamate-cysteine ligase family protein [Candidatus Competibacteraceae bacterium]
MVTLTPASLGVELEMVVACRKDGASHCVGPFFSNLYAAKRARGEAAQIETAEDGRDIAVISALGYTSIDNAFNNLESALGPVGAATPPGGLTMLDAWIRAELDAVHVALTAEGAMLVNFSEHPALAIDNRLYQRIRAPKPIYDYWVNYRGWDHQAGIDAKAQNGPNTGVAVSDAIVALNVMLTAGPALIALFANSPFENGEYSGYRENRLTLWPRMFGHARFAADDRLHRLPSRAFIDLRDYFVWMFGEGSVMQMTFCNPYNYKYKELTDAFCVEGNPSLLTFLRGERWPARRFRDGYPAQIRPSLAHLAFQQFAQFLDARIRFSFASEPSLDEFFTAWECPDGLEELFEDHFDFCYIEGRAGGANFADRELFDKAGEQVAASVLIAPSALQAGLLRNPLAAQRALARWPWEALPALRDAAMRDGLSGQAGPLSVRALCETVVELAGRELSAAEAWMLAYPLYVLRSGRNGADRALAAYEVFPGHPHERMKRLIHSREALLLPPKLHLVAPPVRQP